MDNTSNVVERLRESICGDKCRVMEARLGCDCAEAADTIERLRAERDALRHWSVGHIDALLLYADDFTGDSHVKEAVEFCRIVAPDRELRMDKPKRLEGTGFHPARDRLTPTR